MVDRREVFEAADALRSEGKLVSVRSVRGRMGRKGSNRDVGPLVSQWKADRDYKPHVEIGDVPSSILNMHGKAVAGLWAAARTLAAEEYDDERVRMRAVVSANDEVRNEALQEVDRLTEEIVRLRSEAASLRVLLDRREAHVERMRTEEFWTRTMREVFELMPWRGSMTVEDILPHLRDSVWRETANHQGTFTASVLRKKMQTRADHGKFFLARDDGSFERRSAPDHHEDRAAS